MKRHTRNFFSFWFGLGAPLFFLGALIPVWQAFPVMAILLFSLYVLRIRDSMRTTCCRCPHYDTWNCGLPGKMAKIVGKKRFDIPSLFRIRFHAGIDWFFIIGVALIWIFYSWFTGILALIWAWGAYKIAYGPKKFHGLMQHLKKNSVEKQLMTQA